MNRELRSQASMDNLRKDAPTGVRWPPSIRPGRPQGVHGADEATRKSVTASFRSVVGVPIDWYVDYGFAPETGEDWSDVDARDVFGKGMTLSGEHVAMTDPNNPTSRFVVSSARRGLPVSVDFRPNSTARVYTLQYRNNLPVEKSEATSPAR